MLNIKGMSEWSKNAHDGTAIALCILANLLHYEMDIMEFEFFFDKIHNVQTLSINFLCLGVKIKVIY